MLLVTWSFLCIAHWQNNSSCLWDARLWCASLKKRQPVIFQVPTSLMTSPVQNIAFFPVTDVEYVELTFKNQYIGITFFLPTFHSCCWPENWTATFKVNCFCCARSKRHVEIEALFDWKVSFYLPGGWNQPSFSMYTQTCILSWKVAETTEGVRFRVDNMSLRVDDADKKDKRVLRAKSGVVSEHTKLTFRSASARVFILVQLSEVREFVMKRFSFWMPFYL